MKTTKISKFIGIVILLLIVASVAQPVAAEKVQYAPAAKGVPTFGYPVSYEIGEGTTTSLEIRGSAKHTPGCADQYAIDFAAPNTKKQYGIYPTLPGRVVYAGYVEWYGNVVAIRHWDDSKWDKKYYSIYAHLDSINGLIQVGSLVDTTTRIGWMGKTGRGGNGIVHLHFAVRSSNYVYDGATALYGQRINSDGTCSVITPAFPAKPSIWYWAWLPNLWSWA